MVPNPSHQDLIDLAREQGTLEQLGRVVESDSGDCAFGRFGSVLFSSEEPCQFWYLSNGRDFVRAMLMGGGDFEDEAVTMVKTARYNGWLTPQQQACIAGFGTDHPEPRLVVALPSNWLEVSRTENPQGGSTYRARHESDGCLQISLRYQERGELFEMVAEFARLKFPGKTTGTESGPCQLGFYASTTVEGEFGFARIYYLSDGEDVVLATLIGFEEKSTDFKEGCDIVVGLQLRPREWSPGVTARRVT